MELLITSRTHPGSFRHSRHRRRGRGWFDDDCYFGSRQTILLGAKDHIARAAELALNQNLGKTVEEASLARLVRLVAGWIAIPHTNDLGGAADFEFHRQIGR